MTLKEIERTLDKSVQNWVKRGYKLTRYYLRHNNYQACALGTFSDSYTVLKKTFGEHNLNGIMKGFDSNKSEGGFNFSARSRRGLHRAAFRIGRRLRNKYRHHFV
jgi:hypothetical protein